MNADGKDDAEMIASKIANALSIAASRVMMTCFVLKFLIGVSLYVILQRFVNQPLAELWMLCIFGFVLFKYELLISAIIKNDLLNKMTSGDGDEEKDDKPEQEDID